MWWGFPQSLTTQSLPQQILVWCPFGKLFEPSLSSFAFCPISSTFAVMIFCSNQDSGLKTEVIHSAQLLNYQAFQWTQRVQLDTGYFSWHKWAFSFSRPVLHCPERSMGLVSHVVALCQNIPKNRHYFRILDQCCHKVSSEERSKYASTSYHGFQVIHPQTVNRLRFVDSCSK